VDNLLFKRSDFSSNSSGKNTEYPEHHQEVEGRDHSPQLSTGEATSGVLCPILCSPIQERHGHTRTSPWRWLRDWGISHMTRGWESWGCSVWREEGSGGSYQNVEIPDGREQKRWSMSQERKRGNGHKSRYRK